MANQKLTPLQEVEAQRRAAAEAKANKVPRAFTDEQKATRKERVVKAKDALTRSVGMKGDHVAGARAIGDPHVGGIGTLGNENRFDQRMRVRSQTAIGHQHHPHPVAQRDALGLGLDRAGVGIDIDRGHASSAAA